VFEDGVGQALVTDASQSVVGRVAVRGARVILPPDLGDGRIPGVTVFASSSSVLDSRGLPPHLASFLERVGLPAASKDSLFSAGRQVFFNERTFVPGQPIVAAGPCVADPEGAGVLVQRSQQGDVYVTSGTAAALRAEAGRTPVGESLWGAFAVALIG